MRRPGRLKTGMLEGMSPVNLWFSFLFFTLLTLRRKYLLQRLRRINRVRGVIVGPPAPEWQLPVLVGMVMFSALNLGWSAWGPPANALAQTAYISLPEIPPPHFPETATPHPTNTPMPTLVPSPTFSPTLTPLPIPKTGVIWDPDQAGVYFWQDPGQGLVAQIPNSEVVTFLDEWVPYGGQAWAHVAWEGQVGWVDATIVWRVTMPEYLPVVQKGTYLYSEPAGMQLAWLSPGTPVRPGVEWILSYTPIEQLALGENEQQWVRVTLLDGTEGWVITEIVEKNP